MEATQQYFSPWEEAEALPEPPDRDSHGYLKAGKLIRCTLTELGRRCRRGSVELVWTPNTQGLVPPSEVPELGIDVRAHQRSDESTSIFRGVVRLGIFVMLFLLWFAMGGLSSSASWVYLAILGAYGAVCGVLPIASGVWRRRQRMARTGAGR